MTYRELGNLIACLDEDLKDRRVYLVCSFLQMHVDRHHFRDMNSQFRIPPMFPEVNSADVP